MKLQRPGQYPKQYADMLEQVALENKAFDIECADKHAALSLRGHFYAFKSAVRKAAKAAEILAEVDLSDDTRRWRSLDRLGDDVVVRIEENAGACTVVFEHRDMSKFAQMLKGMKVRTLTAKEKAPMVFDPDAAIKALMGSTALVVEGTKGELPVEDEAHAAVMAKAAGYLRRPE